MDKKDLEEFAIQLTDYVINEFKSYGLDFDFEIPIISINWERLSVNLWGNILPDDVSAADEEVLTKFLEHTFDDFIESSTKYNDFFKDNPDSEYYIPRPSFYCWVFAANEANHPINFEMYIYYNEKKKWVKYERI